MAGDQHGARRSRKPEYFIGIFSDITRQKRDAEHIRFLAYYDGLTGLPNRSLLADRVSQAIAAARRSGRGLALLFMDLDGFKHVNDSLGHLVGRRAAAPRWRAAEAADTRHRHTRALWRRRVRAHAVRRRVCRRRAHGCPALHRGARLADPHRRARDQHHAVHRRERLPHRRRGLRPADQERRHGDVPGEGVRPQPVPACSSPG